MNRLLSCLVVIAISFALLIASEVTAEVVFDSLSDSSYSGALGCCSRTGQSIVLGGTSREIVQFEMVMGTAGPSTFFVEFYKLDGPSGTPGSLIWQSPVQTYPYIAPTYNRKIVALEVPRIQVPDSFAWAVTNVERFNDGLIGADNPPTIGTLLDTWQASPIGGPWRLSPYNLRFGARVNAVPEPTALPLLGLCALSLLGYRSRFRGLAPPGYMQSPLRGRWRCIGNRVEVFCAPDVIGFVGAM